ncbi:MAG: DUF4396 domain-containing protein [Hyphomicrobiales bacterium]
MAHIAGHHLHTHHHHGASAAVQQGNAGVGRLAVQATLHCMTGCAIGEVAGMVIGAALGLGMWQTVGLAVTLAFMTGFGLTMLPLIRSGMGFRSALGIAFAADFVSVSIMEIVDNAVVMAVPGAMMAGLGDPLFWGTLVLGLAVAFIVALPVNIWLIGRGKGHAVVHKLHAGH